MTDDGSSLGTIDGTEQLFLASAPVVIAQVEWQNPIGDGGDSHRIGGTVPPPKLLTGGIPSTGSFPSPALPLTDVLEFSHGNYDGGIGVGFEGTWNLIKFGDELTPFRSCKRHRRTVECAAALGNQ